MAEQQKWSDEQLLLEAEAIVVGRFGTDATYAVLKQVRDDYGQQLATLEAERDALKEEVERLRKWQRDTQRAYLMARGEGANDG